MMTLTVSACRSAGENAAGSQGKTTLMIYMVGSDLEGKSAAGTDDITEITKSGLDTNNNKVLLYAGGCPRWHNDMIDAEENVILRLTENGFQKETGIAQTTMGDAKTLASFLNYCVDHYPADHYALILWDHGNGPLIGYGKDILYDNDALTIQEMRQAMKRSSFSSKNKLDWVGFDKDFHQTTEIICK